MAPVLYHDGQFPPESNLDWQRLIPLIGPATSAVSRYDQWHSFCPRDQFVYEAWVDFGVRGRVLGLQSAFWPSLLLFLLGLDFLLLRDCHLLTGWRERRSYWRPGRTLWRQRPM